MPTFFEEIVSTCTILYRQWQKIELALLQKDFQEARRLLSESVVPPRYRPWIWYISVINTFRAVLRGNRQLQEAYHYLQRNNLMILSGKRVRMRTADLTLRYQQ